MDGDGGNTDKRGRARTAHADWGVVTEGRRRRDPDTAEGDGATRGAGQGLQNGTANAFVSRLVLRLTRLWRLCSWVGLGLWKCFARSLGFTECVAVGPYFFKGFGVLFGEFGAVVGKVGDADGGAVGLVAAG